MRPKDLITESWLEAQRQWPEHWRDWGRQLSQNEISQLANQGCRCEQWELLRCAEDFEPKGYQQVNFKGCCFLSPQNGQVGIEGLELSCGISNATLHDTWIGPQVYIHDCFLISRVWVSTACVLVNCGRVFGSTAGWAKPWSFDVGNELGGRTCEALPELSIEMATYRVQEGLLDKNWADETNAYWAQCKKEYSILHPHVRIFNTPLLKDFNLGTYTNIDSALRLEQVISLSNPDESVAIGAGVQLDKVILQWGAKVTGAAQIKKSIVGEQSSVENGAFVESSFLAPNNHIGKGEITASLLGPFVGMHHQSLLIGVIWPQGRGNVGYGAKVGSNHSGKAPDQEFFAGEGCFFGIGATIKFPAHFQKAPYSIFSSGITCLAQKVEMPFSLINTLSENLVQYSPALNEIFPAWVLGENLYALFRNELKFAERNKARRLQLDPRWLRDDTVLWMLEAWQKCSLLQGELWYDSRHLPELGKNVMSEASRCLALQHYERFITFHALGTVLKRTKCQAKNEEIWVQWLKARGLEISASQVLIQHYLGDLKQQWLDVIASKNKDFTRGQKVFSDYNLVHAPIESDKVVIWAKNRWEEACAFFNSSQKSSLP
jgi:hypothetical protein